MVMRWPFPRIPKLGKDLPATYAAGEQEFDRRLKGAFPIGSSEGALIATLRTDGFAIERAADTCSATLTRGLIVKTMWSVRWRANKGRIEQVWGVYGAIAP